jgi:formylglycine-generating enzyme required for sulfatase activity
MDISERHEANGEAPPHASPCGLTKTTGLPRETSNASVHVAPMTRKEEKTMERRNPSRTPKSLLLLSVPLLLATAVVLSGCGQAASDGETSQSRAGAIQLLLTSVPTGVHCVIVTVKPGKDYPFEVASGQSTTELKIHGLTPGLVEVSARAFDVGCSPLPTADSATWVSETPVDIVLVAGEMTQAQLTLISNGGVDLEIGFQSPDVCAGMVNLPQGFCIDSTEVTRRQYAAWLATSPSLSLQDSSCSWNASFSPDATCMSNSSVCQQNCDNHPQVCVDWCDASAFCKSLGKRLCGKIGGGANAYTDTANAQTSQWYAACSSGGQNNWVYGNTWDGVGICNNYSAKNGSTVPVASYASCASSVSGYKGVYDLSGNVWEWEDSCNGTSGQNDYCHIRGGAWVNCFGPGACDYPYNQDACYYPAALTRQWADPYTGFRCCGP